MSLIRFVLVLAISLTVLTSAVTAQASGCVDDQATAVTTTADSGGCNHGCVPDCGEIVCVLGCIGTVLGASARAPEALR